MASDEEWLIKDREALREIVGEPPQSMLLKTIDHVDEICAAYIAASPFLVLGTRGPDGLLDLSPKGDPAGFVQVLDKKTLAIPERLGNGRFDSFENLLQDPAIALIFLIPGHRDTLRVSGKGRITRDPDLLDQMAVNGRPPRFAILVTVEEAMTHCPKCMMRGGMWEPAKWPDTSELPTLAEATMVHGDLARKMGRTLEEMHEIIENDGKNRLY